MLYGYNLNYSSVVFVLALVIDEKVFGEPHHIGKAVTGVNYKSRDLKIQVAVLISPSHILAVSQ